MEQVVIDAVKAAGRALVLAPTHDAVVARRETLESAGVRTLSAANVEESLDPFTAEPQAALVPAQR